MLRHSSPIRIQEGRQQNSSMGSEIEYTKIGGALIGHLPMKQAAALATTATSVSGDKLASQLSKWWDIESYASHCDAFGILKNEQKN